MQVCNSTWASSNQTTLASLAADVDTLKADNRVMGDVITSMVGIIEGMLNQQAVMSTAITQLVSSTSHTANLVTININTGGWTTPTFPSAPSQSGACTSWNITLRGVALAFFTVKDFSNKNSTPCSNAVADAFIAQVRREGGVLARMVPASRAARDVRALASVVSAVPFLGWPPLART